jgi:hypothetical protein
MKIRTALEIEMFGCDGVQPLQKTIPDLALDDPLFQFRETACAATDSTVRKAEDSALLEHIVGEYRLPEQPKPVDHLAEFTKSAAVRLGEIEKRAPRRRTEIRKMLRLFADRLPGKRGEEFESAFDHLNESCLKYVTQACLSEAV